jgi:hypothetical protein
VEGLFPIAAHANKAKKRESALVLPEWTRRPKQGESDLEWLPVIPRPRPSAPAPSPLSPATKHTSEIAAPDSGGGENRCDGRCGTSVLTSLEDRRWAIVNSRPVKVQGVRTPRLNERLALEVDPLTQHPAILHSTLLWACDLAPGGECHGGGDRLCHLPAPGSTHPRPGDYTVITSRNSCTE